MGRGDGNKKALGRIKQDERAPFKCLCTNAHSLGNKVLELCADEELR